MVVPARTTSNALAKQAQHRAISADMSAGFVPITSIAYYSLSQEAKETTEALLGYALGSSMENTLVLSDLDPRNNAQVKLATEEILKHAVVVNDPEDITGNGLLLHAARQQKVISNDRQYLLVDHAGHKFIYSAPTAEQLALNAPKPVAIREVDTKAYPPETPLKQIQPGRKIDSLLLADGFNLVTVAGWKQYQKAEGRIATIIRWGVRSESSINDAAHFMLITKELKDGQFTPEVTKIKFEDPDNFLAHLNLQQATRIEKDKKSSHSISI